MNPSEMDGDLHEWGDMRSMVVRGLSALGYPSGGHEEFSAHSGKSPQPNYFSKAKIQNLDGVICEMEEKYKNLLICIYICKMNDVETMKQGVCHRNTVRVWLDEAKHLLVKSRYWDT